MQLFAAATHRRDQVRSFEHGEVLSDALPRHLEVLAQLVERAAVVRVQDVEQLAPARIGERLEQRVAVIWFRNRQVFTCLLNGKETLACQEAYHPLVIPSRSYVLWFSQRVGSTVLAQALEDTGVAGRPREWLEGADIDAVLAMHGARDAIELRESLWTQATTRNGVLGIKYGMHAAHHEQLAALLDWSVCFPRCKHVFVTRRDKLRLAISWWRAIKSGEWHRPARDAPTAFGDAVRPRSVDDAYDYDAITQLVIETSVREADIQQQFERWNVTPFTVVYEDLIGQFESTVRAVLAFLGLHDASIPAPAFARLADAVSERWYERYRSDFERRR